MMTMRKEIDDDNAHFTVKHHDFVVLSPGGGGDCILNVRKGSRSKMNEVNAPLSLTYVCAAWCHSRITAPPHPRKTMTHEEQTHVHHAPIFLRKRKLCLSVCLSCIENVVLPRRFGFVLFSAIDWLSIWMSVYTRHRSIYWSIESFACPCRAIHLRPWDGTDTWLRPVIHSFNVTAL